MQSQHKAIFALSLTCFLLSCFLLTETSFSAGLIQLTQRPPNLETTISGLDHDFTPSDQFFERSHLAGIPDLDAGSWRLQIKGDGVLKPIAYSLADLQDSSRFEQVEIAAVAVCSGNRRGLFDPQVPGVQWGHGALGNGLWKGVRFNA